MSPKEKDPSSSKRSSSGCCCSISGSTTTTTNTTRRNGSDNNDDDDNDDDTNKNNNSFLSSKEHHQQQQRCRCRRRDIFLSSDERYEIWCIKAAERPELLEVHDDQDDHSQNDHNNNQNDECEEGTTKTTEDDEKGNEEKHKNVSTTTGNGNDDDDDDDLAVLPLTDGCDIPGWRKSGLVVVPLDEDDECSSDAVSSAVAFNVGVGCTLLRRESQLPIALSTRRFLRKNNKNNNWETLRQRLLTCNESSSRLPKRIQYYCDNNNNSLPIHPWFERQNVPVIIDGCTTRDNWKAVESCTFANLVKRFGHNNIQWRFSDTHGETMSLYTYSKYINSLEGGLTDDAPLGIYDSQFGGFDYNNADNDKRSCILKEYNVPSCFRHDLFDVLDHNDNHNNNRPPYRWILIGPPRSGTGLHIDPIGTHAWVTLVEGCKRWVLFPPNTSHSSIYMQDPQIPSSIWFRDYYDDVMERHGNNAVELVQYPGETVYVPAGWPHLVLNLDLSVAITHNYATEYPSFQNLLDSVRESEPQLLEPFLNRLRKHRPDLLVRYTQQQQQQQQQRQELSTTKEEKSE